MDDLKNKGDALIITEEYPSPDCEEGIENILGILENINQDDFDIESELEIIRSILQKTTLKQSTKEDYQKLIDLILPSCFFEKDELFQQFSLTLLFMILTKDENHELSNILIEMSFFENFSTCITHLPDIQLLVYTNILNIVLLQHPNFEIDINFIIHIMEIGSPALLFSVSNLLLLTPKVCTPLNLFNFIADYIEVYATTGQHIYQTQTVINIMKSYAQYFRITHDGNAVLYQRISTGLFEKLEIEAFIEVLSSFDTIEHLEFFLPSIFDSLSQLNQWQTLLSISIVTQYILNFDSSHDIADLIQPFFKSKGEKFICNLLFEYNHCPAIIMFFSIIISIESDEFLVNLFYGIKIIDVFLNTLEIDDFINYHLFVIATLNKIINVLIQYIDSSLLEPILNDIATTIGQLKNETNDKTIKTACSELLALIND